MPKTVVKVDQLYKSFKLPTEKASSIKQAFVNWAKGVRGYKEQEVLKGISFTVEKGDFFGIVGRNGSGKSTLLKLLSQIYVPDSGDITINGSLVSFIELGVGFNSELTGHDNVYLNGALLGFSSAEVDAMYDDIVDFAELHDFMNQKLKNYSSGMQVRLAFSCAIRAKSDILILDEVLAVGDEAFQRKCNDYFDAISKDQNQTVLLVTHDMESVKRYCNKAVLIKDGIITVSGAPRDVADQYTLDNLRDTPVNDDEQPEEPEAPGIEDFKIELLSSDKLSQDDALRFQVSYTSIIDEPTYFEFVVWSIDKNCVIYKDSTRDACLEHAGNYAVTFSCPMSGLNDGSFKIYAAVRNLQNSPLFSIKEAEAPIFLLRRTDMDSLRNAEQQSAMNFRITDRTIHDKH
jgi:ABC-2 type transport system ATP-binding protein